MEKVLEFVQKEICKDRELLYLCKFGSHLYGTNTPESDTDYKGVFLPTKKEMLLGNKCKSLKYDTGNDDSRNTKEDLDIDLWSLQYFLELVGKGETNALDLLYSPTNEECVVYKNPKIDIIFKNPLRLFNPRKTESYVGYAIGQAKRYGIKGSKLGVLKNVYEYLNNNITEDQLNEKLGYFINKILNEFYDESYCFNKIVNNTSSLVLCGKIHMYSITLKEFYDRVKKEYEKYGDRAKKAEENEGIDWKALSHAVRACMQMRELLDFGKIKFPLVGRKVLTCIKKEEYDWKTVERFIINEMDIVNGLQKTTWVKGNKDQDFVDSIILSLYGEKYG